jgi:hypothetical protein
MRCLSWPHPDHLHLFHFQPYHSDHLFLLLLLLHFDLLLLDHLLLFLPLHSPPSADFLCRRPPCTPSCTQCSPHEPHVVQRLQLHLRSNSQNSVPWDICYTKTLQIVLLRIRACDSGLRRSTRWGRSRRESCCRTQGAKFRLRSASFSSATVSTTVSAAPF